MTTRVGFLGTGLIARFHALMLDGSREDFEKAGCFDVDAEKAASFREQFGYVEAATEDEVLDGCDAVYVTTWTSEHRRLVEAAAARGIHVFCEKPLAIDADQAAAMADVVATAGVTNQVGLVLRRSPAFGLLKALIEDPAAGRPMAVVFRDDQHIPIRGMYGSTWRGDPTKAGAGTLIEHSIHDLDILEHLLGPATSIGCRTAGFHEIAGIEDVAAVSVGFASGATASLTSVWHDVDERPSLRHVEVFSERMYARLEGDWEGPVAFRFAGDDAESVLSDEALATEARRRGARLGNPDGSFLRSITKGTPAWPSLQEAVRAHVLADACYASAAAGGAPVAV